MANRAFKPASCQTQMLERVVERGMQMSPMGLVCLLARAARGAGRRQMGGAEGVRAQEQYSLVIGLSEGMMMHLDARPGVAQAAAA